MCDPATVLQAMQPCAACPSSCPDVFDSCTKGETGLLQAVNALLEAVDLPGSTEVAVPKWQHSQAAGSRLSLQEALQLCYDIR